MYYAIIAAVIIALGTGLVFNYKRSQKIQQNGVETDAVVSRVKEIERETSEGVHDTAYEYFVRYQSPSGEVVEAKLSNPPRFLAEGTQLRIKYLPEKPKYALIVEE